MGIPQPFAKCNRHSYLGWGFFVSKIGGYRMSILLFSMVSFLIIVQPIIIVIGGFKLLKIYEERKKTKFPLEHFGIEGPIVLIVIGLFVINFILKNLFKIN